MPPRRPACNTPPVLCRHHHRVVRLDPATRAPRATPETVFPGERQFLGTHAGNRARTGGRTGRPASSCACRAMARRLQHGRVQSYVLYILVGLAALAAWVFLGAMPPLTT